MAGRILNRRELRQQSDQADTIAAPAADQTAETGPAGASAPAKGRVRKARAKKAPPRMRARWGIFDGGMKQVAVFDYNDRAAAEASLADLLDRKKGIHFLQIVKEEMPAPAAVE
jgi:hypothetical protein